MTAKQRGEYRTDEGRERSEYNIGQRGSRQQISKQTAERYARYRRRCKYRQGAERLGDAHLNNAGGERRGSIGYRGVERGDDRSLAHHTEVSFRVFHRIPFRPSEYFVYRVFRRCIARRISDVCGEALCKRVQSLICDSASYSV